LEKITTKHKEIVKLFRSFEKSKKSKQLNATEKKGPKIDELKKKYQKVLDAAGEGKRTLLHQIVDSPLTDTLLFTWLLKEYPNLILEPDKQGNTALYTAVTKEKDGFINAVLQNSPNKVKALCMPGDDGTCLHRALKLQHHTVSGMISTLKDHKEVPKAGDGRVDSPPQEIRDNGDGLCDSPLCDVLRKLDNGENTPLHIAVTAIANQNSINDQNSSSNLACSEVGLKPLVDVAAALIREYPEAMYEPNKEKQLPWNCLGSAKALTVCADIVREMKRGYMRKFDHDHVVNLLYSGSGQGASMLS
jgi:ankyrin repeat protein